jgi:hypothetical protein
LWKWAQSSLGLIKRLIVEYFHIRIILLNMVKLDF